MIHLTDNQVLNDVVQLVKHDKRTSIIVFTQHSLVESIRLQVYICEALLKKGYSVKNHAAQRYIQVIETGAHIYFGNFVDIMETDQAHQHAGREFDGMVSNRIPEVHHEVPTESGLNYIWTRLRR